MTTPDDAGARGEDPSQPSAWDRPPQPPAWDAPPQPPAWDRPPQPPAPPAAGEQAWGSAPGWGPPPPGYGAPGAGVPAYGGAGWGPPQTESKAIIALVLSIASFVVFPLIPAVVALFLASAARRDIDASGGRLTGDGLVTASRVISWVNIGLCLVVLAIVAVVIAVVVVGGSSSS